jgi:hypothetical protein
MLRFLEKHVSETAGIHVPELYIDDRILMSTSPEGLQHQLDALPN